VIALTTTPNRWTRRLAALLLVLQGLAGGAVPLAHASERLSAPAHVEAQHGAGCVALHDGLRCPLCQFAGSQGSSQPVRTQGRRPQPSSDVPVRSTRRRCAAPNTPPPHPELPPLLVPSLMAAGDAGTPPARARPPGGTPAWNNGTGDSPA